ncbi:EKC/KEOPS complex subunit LAGE3-like [Fukomys damarensis]|uniref:EKC/KEOPS complex subunit LAGE3-like n=1 Tax=Fukomys damarensis TaxID=885580 RepID=UPI00053F31B8|nr:EKC/KEOPS complex subunit LAGE3-like [Fukomys damarensis]
MQAPENGPEGDDVDNRAGGGPVHPTFMGGGEGPGEEVANGGEHLQGQGEGQEPGAGGDASAAAGVNEQEPLEFRLTVPLRYSVNAEIAYWLLDPIARSLQEEIHMEITIDGSELNIRFTSENSHLLEFATAAYDLLHQVSMVFLTFEDLET